MGVTLSELQVDILSTMLALGPQRVNRAISAAEIAEVLGGIGPRDIPQLCASIQSDLLSLASLGLVEHYHTLHEWRLTAAGEAFWFRTESGQS